jgi:O-antigen biosynthesis protein WbqP
MIKRVFDILLSLFLIFLFFTPMVILAICIRLTSSGPSWFWSDRVGRDNVLFTMPKFRTMHIDSPNVATHLMKDPNLYLTPIGGFLRSSSIDELPQLFSVLKGDLSFVGPRPALYNQIDLIALRNENGVARLKPGITGWAQVNGRDELSIEEKAYLDEEYLKRRSFIFDCKILWITGLKVLLRRGISH